MKLQAHSKDKQIERFVELVTQGIDAWIEAGKLVAKEVDEDPEFIDRLCESVPGLSRNTIIQFDRIGRGKIEPRLLLSDKPGAKRLLELPIAEQRRFMNDPVPLLIKTDEGWETLKVDVDNLTAYQAKQVFGKSSVRTEAEQRAWIESQKTQATANAINEPYRVNGRKLVVFESCQFTAKQLAQILAQME